MTCFFARWGFLSLVAGLLFACGGTAYSTAGDGSGGAATGGTGVGGTGGGASTGGSSTGGVVGSGGSHSVYASDFDQSCEWDAQCTPVSEGDVCGCGTCPSAAINSQSLEAYNAAVSAIQCPETDALCPLAPCQAVVGTCPNGTCGVRAALYIDESFGYADCDSDQDCTTIPMGEVCSDCQCQSIAVNLEGAAKYQALANNVKCTRGPIACDCVSQAASRCNLANGSGVCELLVALPQ